MSRGGGEGHLDIFSLAGMPKPHGTFTMIKFIRLICIIGVLQFVLPASARWLNRQRHLDRGDNAWMLASSALVLMMTAPGLAMFYGGLVRKKNVLSVMMQCIFLMGLMTVIWAHCGLFAGVRRHRRLDRQRRLPVHEGRAGRVGRRQAGTFRMHPTLQHSAC